MTIQSCTGAAAGVALLASCACAGTTCKNCRNIPTRMATGAQVIVLCMVRILLNSGAGF